MTAYKGEIWLANVNPAKRSNEVAKVRPVLIFQNDAFNESDYPTTIVLPLTTSLIDNAEPLRYRVKKCEKLLEDSDVLVAQIRSIDNARFIEKLSALTKEEHTYVVQLLNELLH